MQLVRGAIDGRSRLPPVSLSNWVNLASRRRVKVHVKDQIITFKILCMLLWARAERRAAKLHEYALVMHFMA